MVNHTNKSKSTMTTTYQYGNDDLEYVLCSRGRPFVTLVSPTNPTPSSTLIDHNLVRELGLKISDLKSVIYSARSTTLVVNNFVFLAPLALLFNVSWMDLSVAVSNSEQMSLNIYKQNLVFIALLG